MPCTVGLFLLLTVIKCAWNMTLFNNSKWAIEHEVLGREALEEAKMLPFDNNDDPVCKQCSWQDYKYCTGRSVLDDHCCCDRRHKERFPFIPHTCYIRLLPTCVPVATDCEEYVRLYMCCCKAITTSQWKMYSIASSAERSTSLGQIFTLIIWFIKY